MAEIESTYYKSKTILWNWLFRCRLGTNFLVDICTCIIVYMCQSLDLTRYRYVSILQI